MYNVCIVGNKTKNLEFEKNILKQKNKHDKLNTKWTDEKVKTM